jgi:hypothetical protein
MFSAAICVSYLLCGDVPGIGKATTLPRIVVIPNSKAILQRDHLWLMAVVENRATSDIKITSEPAVGGRCATFEVREGESWKSVSVMNELRVPCRDFMGRTVLAGCTYAEFAALQRDATRFVFGVSGKYEVRAKVETSIGPLVSEPVAITVDARSPDHLRQIDLATDVLGKLDLRTLRGTLPENLLALTGVGGNIQRSLDNARLLQEYATTGTVDGLKVELEKLPELLRQRLDPVNKEMALQLLAQHFMRTEELPGLKVVARTMSHDSLQRREVLQQLRFRADPTTPQWSVRSDFGDAGPAKNEKVVSH